MHLGLEWVPVYMHLFMAVDVAFSCDQRVMTTQVAYTSISVANLAWCDVEVT